MKIIVPATSANVGPGFDSVGIAVTRYLTIEVLEPADAWFIEHDLGAGIPTDEKNTLLSTAIFGNLVIASYIGEDVQYVTADFPSCDLVAFVPSYQLKTSDSRNVLPKEWSYKEAVAASSVANVAIAALLKGDLLTAGRSIESDHFHERYRQSLVKEFPQVKEVAHAHGAYATYLSGAGPTIMNLLAPEYTAAFVAALEKLGLDGQIFQLKIDTFGVRVEN